MWRTCLRRWLGFMGRIRAGRDATRGAQTKRRRRANTVTEGARSQKGSVSATSASVGAALSRSESSGSATGHSTADVGVVPGDAGLGRRVVDAGAEVGDVGDVAEHGEAVAEADRDEELAVGLVVEDVALPLAVGGGVAAQVDGDVEDLAARRSGPASPGRARSGSAGRAACPSTEREWLCWTNSTSTPCSAQRSRR